MYEDQKIFVAGHRGMVGSAIVRKLSQNGYKHLVLKPSSELDLRNQNAVRDFISTEKPDAVIIAAARVGGILANASYPYQFLMDNLLIQTNLIKTAHEEGVNKLIFLGSSCIYPKMAPQPLIEEYLLTGSLEPTNEWYALAKITGVKACEAIRNQFHKDFVSLMPTNLYGPYDNFDLETSHVLPSMIRKFFEAAKNGHTPVTLWGSGNPRREFLHVDDLADAVVFAVENQLDKPWYNVGTGVDITIRELADLIQCITGHKGEIIWDSTKPDGTPRKLLDVSRLSELGWKAGIGLDEGITETYNWFKQQNSKVREVKI